MSCRTTPSGALATTFPVQHFRLSDVQCTSLYHELIREWNNTDPIERPPTDRRDYQTALSDIQRELDGNTDISSAMRSRLQTRIAVAQSDMPTDEARVYAATRMMRRAAAADTAIRFYVQAISSLTGDPEEELLTRFRQLARDRTAEHQAGDAGYLCEGMPRDAGTAYACRVLSEHVRDSRNRSRCEQCGEWVSEDGPHVCDVAGASAAPDQPTSVSAPSDSEAISIEEFQSLYDEVQAERQGGDGRLPTMPMGENEPGAVTGGLADPERGMSFGIELEIDFPDEEECNWGDSRETLAAMLYNENISLTPRFQRWHYLGDEGAGRPGGEFEVRPDGWVCEFDRSVDGVAGARGVEIKSQILYDEPETWHNIRRICEIAESLGGKVTPRCGLHVNIGSGDIERNDPTVHTNLVKLFRAYDDVLVRMSHNPQSGPKHRGRQYCAPVSLPPAGYRTVSEARQYANHYQAVNLNRVADEYTPANGSSRIEVRLFDSTLDPNRIQTQVALSLALVQAAKRNDPAVGEEAMLAGSTRGKFGRRRLEGAEWEEATAPMRSLLAMAARQGLNGKDHQKQLMRLFAASRWQDS